MAASHVTGAAVSLEPRLLYPASSVRKLGQAHGLIEQRTRWPVSNSSSLFGMSQWDFP